MNHSRLPIDVCEDIIDACYEPPFVVIGRRSGSYSYWCATALVCSDWSPRSRFNMLYETVLQDRYGVDLLLRTLEERPSYADLIVKFRVSTQGKRVHVAYSRVPVLVQLKNCKVLDLNEVDWHWRWASYPPRYVEASLAPWSRMGIVNLAISIPADLLSRTILRFIWSLPRLETLQVIASGGPRPKFPEPGNWPSAKTGRCEKLRSLDLKRVCSFSLCGSVAHNISKFLPTQFTSVDIYWPVPAFGHHVENLCLETKWGISGMISVHHFKSPLP